MKATRASVEAALGGSVYGVQTLSDLPGLMLRDKILQGDRVKAASRYLQAFTESLRGIKKLIGDGERNLHTVVIP